MKVPFKWSDVPKMLEELDDHHSKCRELSDELEAATHKYKVALQSVHYTMAQALHMLTAFVKDAKDTDA